MSFLNPGSSIAETAIKEKAKNEREKNAAQLERDKMAAEAQTQQRIQDMYFRPKAKANTQAANLATTTTQGM